MGSVYKKNDVKVVTSQNASLLLQIGIKKLLCLASFITVAYAVCGAMEPSDISLAIFKSRMVTDPTVLKVNAKLTTDQSAYNSQIFDYRTKFWAINIRPSRSGGNMESGGLTCYVKKDSEPGRIIETALKDGAEHTALVKLRYSKNEKFNECCVLDEIEMSGTEGKPELVAKFETTRLYVVIGKGIDSIEGRVTLSVRSKLKYFTKPLLRVVLLMEEKDSGTRIIRDCILDDPKPDGKMGVDYNHTRRGQASIGEKSASQPEVAKEKYETVRYEGYRFSKNKRCYAFYHTSNGSKHQLLGYRLECWYKGTCISTFDSFRPMELRKLHMPDDWHVMFKHPNKFKYE